MIPGGWPAWTIDTLSSKAQEGCEHSPDNVRYETGLQVLSLYTWIEENSKSSEYNKFWFIQ